MFLKLVASFPVKLHTLESLKTQSQWRKWTPNVTIMFGWLSVIVGTTCNIWNNWLALYHWNVSYCMIFPGCLGNCKQLLLSNTQLTDCGLFFCFFWFLLELFFDIIWFLLQLCLCFFGLASAVVGSSYGTPLSHPKKFLKPSTSDVFTVRLCKEGPMGPQIGPKLPGPPIITVGFRSRTVYWRVGLG